MRVAMSATAGILSDLALLLIKETVFLLSRPNGKSSLTSVRVPSWIVRSLSLLIGVEVSVSTLQVQRVRVNHSEDVRADRPHVAQSRISEHRGFERILGLPVGDSTCWVSIGGDSRSILEDSGSVAGLYDVTGQPDYPRNRSWMPRVTRTSGHLLNLRKMRL